jgi:hypothetical protein
VEGAVSVIRTSASETGFKGRTALATAKWPAEKSICQLNPEVVTGAKLFSEPSAFGGNRMFGGSKLSLVIEKKDAKANSARD